MDELADAARAAGCSAESLQLRIAADAPYLSSAAERKAYLCGLHAAFLTIVAPTHVAKPAPTSTSDSPARATAPT
jgi:hypothetical protein